MKFNKGLVGGITDLLVLFLIEGRDMYGYEIIQEIEGRSAKEFIFKEGTLYPILHRLEDNGYVNSYKKRGDRGRERKYYSITEDGRAFLDSEGDIWSDFVDAVDMVLNSEKKIEAINANDQAIYVKENILY